MNNSDTNYLNWFAKADEDELSIKAIFEAEGAVSTACFLSQQMAEKYLKGLLIYNNHSFPKVHDLIEMETLLIGDVPEVAALHEDFKILNRYYTETRYPGDYPEFTLKEAREAFAAASRIKEFVLKIIEKSKE
ncbi:MAG: HEPN domain-containing protein [Parcubacteria group bacterium]|nr:HEPN domain-containing protein [Parcubacteria group bacterium]